ncbi:MAG: FAD-dependent oxidoreductase [Spartobacteria bacterium]
MSSFRNCRMRLELAVAGLDRFAGSKRIDVPNPPRPHSVFQFTVRPYPACARRGHRRLEACRGASFSSIAASSCRLSRTMMALGHAAGTACALAKKLSLPLREVPADELRHLLGTEHVELE